MEANYPKWVDFVEKVESATVNECFPQQFSQIISAYLPFCDISTLIPPISLLDTFGSILSCFAYREAVSTRKYWLETLVTCTIMQFGGTTIVGLLLGQTPSWIMSHSAFPALLLVWWLTFFSPGDLFYRSVKNTPVLMLLVGVGSAISAGHAVTSWGMDKVSYQRIQSSLVLCSCTSNLLELVDGLNRSLQILNFHSTSLAL